MISHHETLEEGPSKHRCQVVRWVRSFPFSFLSDREYIIGRRVWRAEDGCLYGTLAYLVWPELGHLCFRLGLCREPCAIASAVKQAWTQL
jgi:hypothetical protein